MNFKKEKKLVDIVDSPLLSEKSYDLSAKNNVATFWVSKNATKFDIAQAVQYLFSGVKVIAVKVLNVKGKVKTRRNVKGKRADRKKAYVYLSSESKIDCFDLDISE